MTLPPATDAAVAAWMTRNGWPVPGARFELDPQNEFRVWQEVEQNIGRSHALWIAESMVRRLSAEDLVAVLDKEGMADEMRISYKVRIEERGDGYRVSVVPRPSGEMKRLDL